MNSSRAQSVVREALRSPVARERRYGLRPYQLEAGFAAYRALRRRRTALLNLPTGTGKTLISNLISLFWHTAEPDARGVVVAPRRVLVAQHREMSRWLAPGIQSFALDETTRQHPQLRALTLGARLLISTPQLLANVIGSHQLPDPVIDSIRYVIIDEFDEFLQFHYTEEGTAACFDEAFESLQDAFRGRPMLLMSATSPLEPGVARRGVVATTLAGFVQQTFDPVLLKVDPGGYRRFLPTARIRVEGIHDRDVLAMDLAIQTERTRCFDDLIVEVGGLVDEPFVLSRLEGLLAGTVRYVRLADSTQTTPVTPRVRGILSRLRGVMGYYEFLFEDMFRGYEVEVKGTRLLDRDAFRFYVEDRHRVIPPHDGVGEFWPEPRGKARFLMDLLRKSDQRGVVFLRNLRLLDMLIGEIRDAGFRAARLDGEMTDREREAAVTAFRAGPTRLLFITRETGKRGLDLPHADYAVFYSPKAREDTVWQELSRIRSNVARTKDTYILFYTGTAEERKLRRLVRQMDASGRGYRLVLPSRDWLSTESDS